MSALQIAVLGCGLIGKRHIAQARKHGVLCAVADPDPAARDVASKSGVPHYSDPVDLLRAKRPDGVVIATPNHLHADHAVMSLEQGVPCLIEKPIADTLQNADRIVAASARFDVPVLVGHHRRHNQIVAKAKEVIDQGRLGDLVTVSGEFWLYKPDDYFDAEWRKKSGAGPMLINCIHDIDLLRYLCGEISEIQSFLSNNRRGSEVEDSAALVFRFENGAVGSFTLSDTVVAPWSWEMTSGENSIYPNVSQSCYRLGGTRGSLSIPDLTFWSHPGRRSWWEAIDAEDLSEHSADPFERQFLHFCDVIRDKPPLVSPQEGRKSLEVVLRCLMM